MFLEPQIKNICPKSLSVGNISMDPGIRSGNLGIILDSFPHPKDSATYNSS